LVVSLGGPVPPPVGIAWRPSLTPVPDGRQVLELSPWGVFARACQPGQVPTNGLIVSGFDLLAQPLGFVSSRARN